MTQQLTPLTSRLMLLSLSVDSLLYQTNNPSPPLPANGDFHHLVSRWYTHLVVVRRHIQIYILRNVSLPRILS